jgi:hypothetical protein
MIKAKKYLLVFTAKANLALSNENITKKKRNR